MVIPVPKLRKPGIQLHVVTKGGCKPCFLFKKIQQIIDIVVKR